MRFKNGTHSCGRVCISGMLSIGLATALVACGGGSGDPLQASATTPAADPTILTGRFFDAPTAGLLVRTPTLTSTTDAEGRYSYREDEPVEFLIGEQSIGVTRGKSLVSVYDLTAPGFSAPTGTSALRIAQTLQSLDADNNPSNGISIVADAKSWFSTAKLDFTASAAEFAAAFKTAAAAGGRTLVAASQAQAHVDSGIANITAEYDSACGVPAQALSLDPLFDLGDSVGSAVQATVNCEVRAQIVGYRFVVQPAMRAELDMLNEQAAIFASLADNSAAVTSQAKKQSLVGRVVDGISFTVDLVDELGELKDEKNASASMIKAAAITAKLATRAVELAYQPSDWKNAQQAQLVAQLAQSVINSMSNSAQCVAMRKSGKRDDACIAAVMAGFRIVNNGLSLASLDDEKATQALLLLGAAIDEAQALSSARGTPVKVAAAHQQAAVTALRSISTLIALGYTADGSAARALWTGGIDTVANVADTYLSCRKPDTSAFGIKRCKDALEKSFVDKTIGLALNASLLLDFTTIDSQTKSLLLADRLVRDYLASGADLPTWYAKYDVTDGTTSQFCWQTLKSCSDSQLTNERVMFDQLVAKLVGNDGAAKVWGKVVPRDATWQRFQEVRTQLKGLQDFYAGAQALQLLPSVDQSKRTVTVTVKGLPSKIDTIQCTALNAMTESVDFPTGKGGTAVVTYAASGTYGMTCTGQKSGAAVAVRSVSWTLGVCAAGESLTKGQCQRIVDGAPAVKSFSDEFNATALNALAWNTATKVAGHATEARLTGSSLYTNDFGAVDTKGKVHFSGEKIVVEGRAWGPGTGRGTAFYLIDTKSGEGISISDTTYYDWGFNANGNGAYNFVEVERPRGVGAAPQNCTALGGSTSSPMEYRMTLVGNRITFERGPTLATITQSATRTLGRSIAGRTFYLLVGTGDVYYTPAYFDWVRVAVD